MTNLDQIELLLNENQRLKDELREAASAVQTLTAELGETVATSGLLRTELRMYKAKVAELEAEVVRQLKVIGSFT